MLTICKRNTSFHKVETSISPKANGLETFNLFLLEQYLSGKKKAPHPLLYLMAKPPES